MGTIANAFNKMSLGVGGGSAGSLAGTHAEAPSAAILGARGEAGGGGEAGGSRAIAITAPQVGVMTAPRADDAAGDPANSLKMLMANQAGAAQCAKPSLGGVEAKRLFISA
jgi:hypothetical protein